MKIHDSECIGTQSLKLPRPKEFLQTFNCRRSVQCVSFLLVYDSHTSPLRELVSDLIPYNACMTCYLTDEHPVRLMLSYNFDYSADDIQI